MTRLYTAANRCTSLAVDSFELTAKTCKVTVVARPCRCGEGGARRWSTGWSGCPRACAQQRQCHGRSSTT